MVLSSQFSSLPGIRKIFIVPTESLSSQIILRSISGQKIIFSLDKASELAFFGVPTCQTTTAIKNNGWFGQCSLEFVTDFDLSTLSYRIAFVVQTVNNKYFLIGAKEPPYPLFKSVLESGTPSGDSATYKVSVSHIAPRTLIECAV